jgi:NADP-dependent 3-hydroxy acid dehydrogenase YdfG
MNQAPDRSTAPAPPPSGEPTPHGAADASFAGRIAAVTGASSGIGRAIALALAARGASVCLVGRDPDRLASVAGEAQLAAPVVFVRPTDLASDDELDRLAEQLAADLPRLDVLVHSAGVHTLGSHADTPAEDLDVQYRVNVRAPYRLTQAVLPLLRASRGSVVFINSSAGLRAGRSNGLYASTKHALRALADSLRDEVNADGIRVLSVYPGRVDTPLQREALARAGAPYEPAALLRAQDVAAIVVAALSLPETAEVTDIQIRPTRKSY